MESTADIIKDSLNDGRQTVSEGSKPEKQYVKLIEEYGELARGIAKKNEALIKDSIGDTLVVCIILQCNSQ